MWIVTPINALWKIFWFLLKSFTYHLGPYQFLGENSQSYSYFVLFSGHYILLWVDISKMYPFKLLLILGKILLLNLYTYSDTLNTHLPICCYFQIAASNQWGLHESEQGKISCNPQKMLLTGFSNYYILDTSQVDTEIWL